MSRECNSTETINVSEGVDVVTEIVDKGDDLRSKFKGIFFNYNLNKDRYDFVGEIYFFAPIPSNVRNAEIGSRIRLNLPITKVYMPLVPGIAHPGRDILIKIVVQHDCEYTRNGKTVQESQYEIPFESSLRPKR